MDRQTPLLKLLLTLTLLLGSGLCCAESEIVSLWRTVEAPEPTSPPMPTPIPPTSTPAPRPETISEVTAARLNETLVPIHDPVALRQVLAPDTRTDVSSDSGSAPSEYRVGDQRRFRLNGPSLNTELIHVTDHTYTWLTEDAEADHADLIAAADYFESEIYPVVRQHFGSEWSPGVDADVRLSILHYYDPDDSAAGYFSPSDELPRWVEPTSNETEMFYVNLDGTTPGGDFYFAVLAHEFQHMIHWNNDRNETDWLDEGLAELACRLAGFDPGSNDESFLRQPDTQLNHWPYDGDTTVHYGAGYLFALNLWERFGDDFIWDLAHQPADGMAALEAELANHDIDDSADGIFADWVVMNATDDGEYTYATEDWKVNLGVDEIHDQYPVTRDADVRPYGTDYVELTGEGQLLIDFEGEDTADLLPVRPHTGKTVWWSNRGNRSDARLMRRFDLSGLSGATLSFWTWYDLESGYDYVYLSISRDGGRTWEVLRGPNATSDADYGSAYNGRSNGWIEERIDIDRYAGGEVWVRFDYVTDDSINGDGFMIDDVSIPELGLMDPCDEVGEWQAEGFVLAGPIVPQRWVVQLIETMGEGDVRVRRMALSEQQRGQLELNLTSEAERTLLAISALARGTTDRAFYRYEITPR